MQLLPECHLVASGYLGFGLTSQWDAHAYLVVSDDEAVLIDSGCGRATPAVGNRIAAILGSDIRLVGVALTHSHVDHSGGAAELAERFSAPVFAHSLAIQNLKSADEIAIGLVWARNAGVYPADLTLRSVPEVVPVEDTEIRVGQLRLRAVGTPGHSADHLAYVVDLTGGRALFSGDLVFSQGRIALLELPDSSAILYEESLRLVDAIHPDFLFPGHGAVALGRGFAHVDAAVDRYDRNVRPEQLIA